MPARGGQGSSRQPTRGGAASNPAASAADADGSANPGTSLGSGPSRSVSVSSRGAAAAGSSSGTKFRPKGNRRSEAERERIAREQERIQNKKIADDARLSRRGRYRRAGRSRGGFRDRDARFVAASGPLGEGSNPVGGYGSRGSGFHGSGSGMGGGSGSSRARAMTRMAMSNKYSFADGIEEDNRINADELRARASDSDEDERSGAKITTTSRKRRPILPVGIRREEYQAQGATVATAEDIEVEEKGLVKEEVDSDSEEMWVETKDGQGVELEKDEGVWQHAAPKPRGKVKIKREDGQEIETTEIDEIAAHGQIKEPLSPEAKKAVAADMEAEDKPKKRKAVQRDPEEAAAAEDLEQLLGLLAFEHDKPENAEGEAGRSRSALEGNMFLFQFPPVLPPLKKASKPAPQVAVKDEPNDDDVVMFNQPPGGTPANIDLTAEEAEKVKAEDDAEEGPNGGPDSTSLYPEGGFIGKLVVRKSGKVELDWGGQTLELVSGIPAQFLTTAILLEEHDTKAQPGQIAGTAYGMGKIEGKFVLAPKWGDEEEWEFDLDDMPPSEENA